MLCVAFVLRGGSLTGDWRGDQGKSAIRLLYGASEDLDCMLSGDQGLDDAIEASTELRDDAWAGVSDIWDLNEPG